MSCNEIILHKKLDDCDNIEKELEKIGKPMVVISVFFMYLKETLPEPILTKSLTPKFLQIYSKKFLENLPLFTT